MREIEAAARIEIKPSLILDGGRGAFARVPIGAGEYLGQYRGEVLTKAQYAARYPGDRNAFYVLDVLGKFVDAVDESKSTSTRFINASDNPFHPLQANCEFRRGGKVYAIRNIAAGAELYVEYGKEYENMTGVQCTKQISTSG